LCDLSLHLFIYFSRKSEIRRSVKELILNNVPQDKLFHLSFNIHEKININWLDSKEFEFNGALFDVLKIDTSRNTISITAYEDKNEQNLILSFKDFLSDKLNDKLIALKNLPILLIEAEPFSFFNSESFINYHILKFASANESNQLSGFLNIESPPPKL
jgi:hypothetical protein